MSSNSFFSTIGSYLGVPLPSQSEEANPSENATSESILVSAADKKTKKRKGAAKDDTTTGEQDEKPDEPTPVPSPKAKGKQKKQTKAAASEIVNDEEQGSSLIIPMDTSTAPSTVDADQATNPVSLPHKKQMKRNADIDQAKGNIPVDDTKKTSGRVNRSGTNATSQSTNPVVIDIASLPPAAPVPVSEEKSYKRNKKQKEDVQPPSSAVDTTSSSVPINHTQQWHTLLEGNPVTDLDAKKPKKGGRKPKIDVVEEQAVAPAAAETNTMPITTEAVVEQTNITDVENEIIPIEMAVNDDVVIDDTVIPEPEPTSDLVISSDGFPVVDSTTGEPVILSHMEVTTASEMQEIMHHEVPMTLSTEEITQQPITDGHVIEAPVIEITRTGRQKKKRDLPNHSWQKSYEALIEYGNRHNGDCNIPQADDFECYLPLDPNDQIVPTNPLIATGQYHYVGKLGKWLDNQRTARKQALKNGIEMKHKVLEDGTKIFRTPLLPEREASLQKLVDEGKLSWDNSIKQVAMIYKTEGEIIWKRHYAALNHYYDSHGHCNIAQRQVYECDLPGLGPNGTTYHYKAHLGIWLDNQRNAKRGTIRPKQINRSILLPEREATLQTMVDAGKLSWEGKCTTARLSRQGNPNLTNLDEEAWYRHYAALLEFGKEHGHCNIPVRGNYECEIPEMVDTQGRTLCPSGSYSGKLGHWLDNQRTGRKKRAEGPNKDVTSTRHALLLNLVEQGMLNWDPLTFSMLSKGRTANMTVPCGKSSSSSSSSQDNHQPLMSMTSLTNNITGEQHMNQQDTTYTHAHTIEECQNTHTTTNDPNNESVLINFTEIYPEQGVTEIVVSTDENNNQTIEYTTNTHTHTHYATQEVDNSSNMMVEMMNPMHTNNSATAVNATTEVIVESTTNMIEDTSGTVTTKTNKRSKK